MGSNEGADEHLAITELILERFRTRWEREKSPGFLARLFGPKKPVPILVVETEAADPETFECVGDCIRAWRIDESGMRELPAESADPGEPVKGRFQVWLARFFVSDENDFIFLNEMEGPKRGTFIQFVHEAGTRKLKVKRARALLNGSLVG